MTGAPGRAVYDAALRRAREAAYPPGEFAGQESFMRASEILALARGAGIGPGADVLDLCCGVAGPGRLIARELGCSYLGVDADEAAVAVARDRAAGLPCRFAVAAIPPLPAGRFDVVLLLETLLAFPDKAPLVDAIAGALAPGGRFACSFEEGAPLTADERARMPGGDTVWPVPLDELAGLLARAGLELAACDDRTADHAAMASALAAAFEDDAAAIGAAIGAEALGQLVVSHELWAEWLGAGRVRKLALVARARG